MNLTVAMLVLLILLLSFILVAAAFEVGSEGWLMVRIPKKAAEPDVIWEQVVIATLDSSMPATKVVTNDKWYMILLPNEPGLRVTVKNKDGRLNGSEIVYLDDEMRVLATRKVPWGSELPDDKVLEE